MDLKMLYEQVTMYCECIHTESDGVDTTETFVDTNNSELSIVVEWNNDRIRYINFINNTIDNDDEI